MALIEHIAKNQKKILNLKTSLEQKKIGQFFTDAPIATFMSSLIDLHHINSENINFLDCGAGCGILTFSTALYFLKSNITRLHAVLYEIDEKVLEELNMNMNILVSVYQKENKMFSYEIVNKDFILERPDKNSNLKFDISIINPPYFKYSVTDSIYSKATSDLYKGDPNIYASFIAVMVSTLNNGGQCVVISPRSFLNGLYFKGFREYLLNNSNLESIHVFKSRDKVFLDSEILQENIIFKLNKYSDKNTEIIISTSHGTIDINCPIVEKYPRKIIIDESNSERMIRIPEKKEDYNILNIAESLPSTFSKEKYFISTGPVVEHRTSHYLSTYHEEKDCVPLIKAHNVSIDGIKWDGKKKKDLSFNLYDLYEKHLLPNSRYVILKRFTAKDEMRRLVSGVFKGDIAEIKHIGITNKLNYLGVKGEIISEVEAEGLAAIFNSTFMDKYYRCISGNTQVNATDIRILKFPTRKMIISIGEKISKLSNLDYDKIDNIVNDILKIKI